MRLPAFASGARFHLQPPDPGRDAYVEVLPWPRSPLLTLVLAGFTVVMCIPYAGAGEMLPERFDDLFEVVSLAFVGFWYLGWSAGIGVLVTMMLAPVLAADRVIARPGRLMVRVEMLGIGFEREFEARELRFERVDPEVGSALGWRGLHLAFEHDGTAVRIGAKLEPAEAIALEARLRAMLERRPVAPPLRDPEGRSPFARAALPERGRAPRIARGPTPIVDTLRDPPVIALLLANVLPLAGVALLDWDVGDVMLLYWAESGVIGFWNLVRMAVVGGWAALFLGAFFVGHFGGFMAGHLLFIFGFFIADGADGASLPEVVADFVFLLPAVLALFVSHGISFRRNFLGRREYEQVEMGDLMTAPYGRIVVMHLTIILGGFASVLFENPAPALVLLIVLKVAADLRAHVKEHRSHDAAPGGVPGAGPF